MMKPHKPFLILLVIFYSFNVFALDIPIRLMPKHSIKSIVITDEVGKEYKNITSRGINITDFSFEAINIIAIQNKLRIIKSDTIIGEFISLSIGSQSNIDLLIRIIGQDIPPISSLGKLQLVNKDGLIQITSYMDIEEITLHQLNKRIKENEVPISTLPIIAIIERSNLLNAYSNTQINDLKLSIEKLEVITSEPMLKAVERTKGKVLADSNQHIIFTPFHKACGGRTSSITTQQVMYLDHLRGVEDEYCQQNSISKRNGHGIGLCLAGAEIQLKSDKELPEIFAYYLPGVILIEKYGNKK